MNTWTFKSSRARRYHTAAIAYALLGYSAGWWLLFNGGWAGFIPGVLLLGHGMIIAAYLIHECAHNTIFKSNHHNSQLASLLAWVCGACYGTIKDIRTKHFRHHVENDDAFSPHRL